MLTICTKVTEFDEVRALAESHDDIWCSVGVHPHEAADQPETDLVALVQAVGRPRRHGADLMGGRSLSRRLRPESNGDAGEEDQALAWRELGALLAMMGICASRA